MNRSLIAALLAALILAGAVYAFASSRNDGASAVTNSPVASASPEVALTLAEVAKHANAQDCWTAIDGQVYTITSYISKHPGGEDVLRACGRDGSKLFNERKTDDGQAVGSGTAHSSQAASMLESYKLGALIPDLASPSVSPAP